MNWQHLLVLILTFGLCLFGSWLYIHIFQSRRPTASESGSRGVAAIVLGLALASAVQVVWFQVTDDRKRDCQYKLNTAIIETLKDRAGPNNQADEALKTMAQSILDAKTANDTRSAIRTFIDAMNAKKKAQEENPLPEIPSNCRP